MLKIYGSRLCPDCVRFLSDLENGKETVQINKLMRVVSLLGMDLMIAARGE